MVERTKIVEVVPYNSDWKTEFENIKDMLMKYIGNSVVRIEHVGSTSIPGLSAKPIIDVDVVIESPSVFPEIVERLAKEGFVHQGDLGIEGREAFKRSVQDDHMSYHLYVCLEDGKGYLEHIAFRDYLRANEDERDAYASLKKELAEKHRYEIDSYCDGKTGFIHRILERAR